MRLSSNDRIAKISSNVMVDLPPDHRPIQRSKSQWASGKVAHNFPQSELSKPHGVSTGVPRTSGSAEASKTRRGSGYPAELFHGQSSMPDLRHVPNLLTLEIHHIHIVCLHALASWWAGATLASMSARKDAIRTDALPLIISAEGLQFISSVRNEGQQTLHPVGVLLKVLHASKW